MLKQEIEFDVNWDIGMKAFNARNTILFSLLLVFMISSSDAQLRHMDYLGAGHKTNIKVRASSSSNSAAGSTVDGFRVQSEEQLRDASRFLAQCTFGTDISTIQTVAAMGPEAWLEEQFELPILSYHEEEIQQTLAGYGFGYRLFGSSWMTINISSPDLVRQRMAFNLSQILVLSGNTMMIFQRTDAHPLAAYYDLLQNNAFENYFEALNAVSLSPQMGHFLSHYNNPREDTLNNVHPDENFAREVMQLFSIGLWQLNDDGSRKLDIDGNFIPSYDNADIKEFAQVFTGLGSNNLAPFGAYFSGDWTKPMKMFEEYHDNSSKELLDGYVIPGDKAGMEDIRLCLEHLSTHPNTAVFISESLIKKFTSSNPSPQYIKDVASVFAPLETNNFRDLIRAILFHPEARTCPENISDQQGKLKEPLVRMMNLLKAFPISSNQNGDYWNFMRCPVFTMGQAPLQAPSVFNFYEPDYSPPGAISDLGLEAPEFQLLSAPNTIGIINDVDTRILNDLLMDDGCGIRGMFEPEDYEEDITQYQADLSSLAQFENEPEALIDRLGLILAQSALSDQTKQILVDHITQINDFEQQIRFAIYGILISPDYAILK